MPLNMCLRGPWAVIVVSEYSQATLGGLYSQMISPDGLIVHLRGFADGGRSLYQSIKGARIYKLKSCWEYSALGWIKKKEQTGRVRGMELNR